MKTFIISFTCLILVAATFASGSEQKSHTALYEIKRDGKIGFINRAGKEVVPPRFDDVRGKFVEGMTRIQVNDLWGFMNNSGVVVITPVYEENDEFSEGLARVRSKKKYGFVDRTGKLNIQAEFDDAGNFAGGMAKVNINNRWGFIDTTGKKVVQPEYKDADDFREGLGRVKASNNRWGYVNKSGTIVIKPVFESADPFVEGLALVELDGKKGYIDRSGKFVWGPAKY